MGGGGAGRGAGGAGGAGAGVGGGTAVTTGADAVGGEVGGSNRLFTPKKCANLH